MVILILGNASDAHAAHLKQALEQEHITTFYWDTRLFPTQIQLSWQPDRQTGSLVLPNGQRLKLQEIHSIFWRSFSGVFVPSLADSAQHQIGVRDATSTLRSVMQACPAHWVNSWKAYQFHQEKPLQLAAAKQVGATIPATLISNDPEQVIEFAHHYEKVIFKPVYGGAHTQFLTAQHLESNRLQTVLRLSPVTIQEYISGTNLRSYVIGKAVFTAEIRSKALDFREDQSAQLIPFELPEAIQKQCRSIAQAFFLEWTAIDWRLTPTGKYVFLEANPSPMFLHFEGQTGFPITESLVQLLKA
jgi:glutathione synthase/RimK-type ligase-like ATP-grasp enzyme